MLAMLLSKRVSRWLIVVGVWFAVGTGMASLWALSSEDPAGEDTESTEASATAPQSEGAGMADRWARVLTGDLVAPAQPVQSAVRVPQPSSGAQELVDQFFFRLSFDYEKNWVDFTGDPTQTFIANEGPPYTINEDGTINYPPSFEENDSRFYGRFVFGTRGYGSDRLNTYFSVLSYSDLDKNSDGSPFLGILDSYDNVTRHSLLNAYFEVEGFSDEGFLSRLFVRVGRQYTHSYTNQVYLLGGNVMDGASFDFRGDRFNLGAFAGSRPAIFSKPTDRLIAGANFGADLGGKARFDYDMVYYADSVIQNFAVQPKFEGPIRVKGLFRMVEDHPVDLGVSLSYSGRNLSLYANVFDRLTDNDYVFDTFLRSPSRNTESQPARLYLGSPAAALRFTGGANYQLGPWFNVGGRYWQMALHDSEERNGFDTSFQDYSANLTVTPPSSGFEFMAEYRFRDVDRGDPLEDVEFFDDIRNAGETEFQEVSGSVGYRWFGRLRANVGTYYRLFDLQNQYYLIDNSQTIGYFGSVWYRLHENIDFRLIYNTDNDYAIFNPDIDWQRGLRIGVDFHR